MTAKHVDEEQPYKQKRNDGKREPPQELIVVFVLKGIALLERAI